MPLTNRNIVQECWRWYMRIMIGAENGHNELIYKNIDIRSKL